MPSESSSLKVYIERQQHLRSTRRCPPVETRTPPSATFNVTGNCAHRYNRCRCTTPDPHPTRETVTRMSMCSLCPQVTLPLYTPSQVLVVGVFKTVSMVADRHSPVS